MGRPFVVVDSAEKGRALQACMGGEVDLLQLSAVPLSASCREKKDKLKKEPPAFDFNPLPAGKDFLSALESAFDREIWIAFDNSLEGEYLAWMLNGYIVAGSSGGCVPRHIRVVGLTPEEVAESIHSSEPFQEKMASGYFVRGLFDGCFRKHLQRLIGTGFGPGGLSLNLASLTTVFFLADREMEIKTFAPALKWEVHLDLTGSGNEFRGRLCQAPGESGDGYFLEPEKVKKAVESFKDGPIVADEIIEEEMEISPPGPCSLTALIEEAYVVHHIQPTRVIESLRVLQHGVEISGRWIGLVSVAGPLPESTRERFVARIRGRISEEFGRELLEEGRKAAQDENCLYPLRPEVTEKELEGIIENDTLLIYGILRRRGLASQMIPAKVKKISVTFRAEGECYIGAECRVAVNEGFMSCYRGISERSVVADHPLLALEEEQSVAVSRIVPEKSPGFPPEYYTLESLYAELADFSITAESSAAILEGLITGDYIDFDGDGAIHCRENLVTLNSVIARAFPSMIGLNLSAYIEQTIGEVLSGRKPLDFALQQFDQTLFMQGKVIVKVRVVDQLKSRGSSSKVIKSTPGQVAAETTNEMAVPEISGEALPVDFENEVPEERFEDENLPGGESVADHSEWTERPVAASRSEQDEIDSVDAPDLGIAAEQLLDEDRDFTPDDSETEWPDEVKELFADEEQGSKQPSLAEQPRGRSVEDATEQESRVCPVCSSSMILKEDRFGRFWSCSGFPSCRHSESFEKSVGADLDCPLCATGKIVSKITPTGKPFYVCPEADCEFMAWSRPHRQSCASCGSPFLVEKKVAGGGIILRCPRAGCGYSTSAAGEGVSGGGSGLPGNKRKVRVRRVSKGVAPAGGGAKRKVRIIRRKS
ncbi:MAG: topoisomerase DNA-binding C4 zinc finger domain-containing protein [Proteobacteria bacterium]|nr:topoisomerase DNA-binding C4 zinc finger domain-containing protein [Pseudomonadota bacterium]MBU1737694.1 topoisomerase DNA-binding C4 zinc finger domain-containing protein [Pseudomonadota bacterium]